MYGKNKKKTKKKTTKKNYKRSRSMFKKSSNAPMAKSFKFKTRYHEDGLSVNPGAGGILLSHVFTANGLFNPNITGGVNKHRVLGFDQLMLMYDHYNVIGCRARIDFINTDANLNTRVGVYINDDANVIADPYKIIENGLGKYMTLGKQTTSKGVQSMTINTSIKKFFKSKVLSDDKLRGNATSNPAEQLYIHVWADNPQGNDPAAVSFTITIEYIAILTEPKKLNISQ